MKWNPKLTGLQKREEKLSIKQHAMKQKKLISLFLPQTVKSKIQKFALSVFREFSTKFFFTFIRKIFDPFSCLFLIFQKIENVQVQEDFKKFFREIYFGVQFLSIVRKITNVCKIKYYQSNAFLRVEGDIKDIIKCLEIFNRLQIVIKSLE